MKSKVYAKVIVDVSSSQVDRPFDYFIPDDLVNQVCVGSKVIVTFKNRKIEGYVIEISNKLDYAENDKLKPIISVIEDSQTIPHDLIILSKWASEKYVAPMINCLHTCIPASVKGSKLRRSVYLTQKNYEDVTGLKRKILDQIDSIRDYASFELSFLKTSKVDRKAFSKAMCEMAQDGYIEISSELKRASARGASVKGVCSNSPDTLLSDAENIAKRKPAQSRVLRCFHELCKGEANYSISVSDLANQVGVTSSVIKALISEGTLRQVDIDVKRDPLAGKYFERFKGHELTSDQRTCVEEVTSVMDENRSEVFLLHGVTGSGKTEVYLRILEHAVSVGKKGVLLVPDISLTPQMVKSVKSRFGSRVAILHSRLSHGERYDEWMRARLGEVDIVVGVRSAVFAPLENIGVIIVDEEHDSSYKQSESPHYSAREVAIKRGEIQNAVVLLGSATPSIETYYKTSIGEYRKLVIDKRIDDKSMPRVFLIDMREEFKRGNRSLFSNELTYAMSERLISKEQVILFMNRRGYSTFVLCRECGSVLRCPNCDVALVYHAKDEDMTCHYCDHKERVPQECRECGSTKIKYFGAGTERVEEEVKKFFPEARVLRMDLDTTRTKDAHARILGQFANGEADVLVGTQMIAKGLDIHNVTLVGVVAADTMLNLPDFRSAERTFQLISQVAGRAGRGKISGDVIVQSYSPDHYSLRYAAEHDYAGFYYEEIKGRISHGYPPLRNIMRLLITSSDSQLVEMEISNLYRELVKLSFDNFNLNFTRYEAALNNLTDFEGRDIHIALPSAAPIPKIAGKYRWHIILRSKYEDKLASLVRQAVKVVNKRRNSDLNLIINFDPQSIL